MPDDNGADAPATDAPAALTATLTQQPSPDLGDAGKKAIEAERRERAKAQKEAKELRERLEKIEAANQSEAEKALKQARDEGRSEALKVANERLLRAAVMTAASGVLVNPKIAPGLLDLSQFEVDDDGNVDEKAIAAAIADLVENEPYLAGATPEPAWGPAGGGAREQTTSRTSDPMLRDLKSRLGI